MKKILITGGMGFIGSNLTMRLIHMGYHVTIVDNLYSSKIKQFKDADDHNYKFINSRLKDIEYQPYDFIYNLACPASPPVYQKDEIFTIETSTIDYVHLLNLALKFDIPIYHSSTSEVYGDPNVHPQTESYLGNVSSWGPRACYDESKRLAETLSFIYKNKYNLNIKVGRIFNTYGPYMDINDGRVISNFITQALKNEDMTVYGDGTQTRSLCFIDDLVDLLILIFENDIIAEKPFNMGNPSEISVLEIAETIKKMTNSKSKIIFKDLPEDDPKVRQPDISYINSLSDWKPKVPLSQGLNTTIHYFDKVLNNIEPK
tara:strand:- start:82 stop:1029 length:948 start_codon:yes stop_codon:yes gene_type:complete